MCLITVLFDMSCNNANRSTEIARCLAMLLARFVAVAYIIFLLMGYCRSNPNEIRAKQTHAIRIFRFGLSWISSFRASGESSWPNRSAALRDRRLAPPLLAPPALPRVALLRPAQTRVAPPARPRPAVPCPAPPPVGCPGVGFDKCVPVNAFSRTCLA